MTILIIIFSSLIFLAGVTIIINPEVVFGYLSNNSKKVELQILAVVVRLVLGALLISQADASKYPIVIEIIGWISIAAALFLAVIGRQKFIRFITLALKFVNPYGRIAGILTVAFGAFLIYAFV